MDFFILLALFAFGFYALNSQEQRKRIALLGQQLGQFQIEKLMESLTQGYLRALGEKDLARRDQIWQLLDSNEAQLCEQFKRFAADFAKLDGAQTQVSTIAFAVPFANRLLPSATFDLRKAFAIHAQGLERAAHNTAQRSPRDKAFTLSAELFLMQHTCHWFCKSKNVASARLLVRHQTAYAQVLAAVSPETRNAYQRLVANT
jgi:hypothetical protein